MRRLGAARAREKRENNPERESAVAVVGGGARQLRPGSKQKLDKANKDVPRMAAV
jgi:hypothetical protein